jgi:hypothetical protein
MTATINWNGLECDVYYQRSGDGYELESVMIDGSDLLPYLNYRAIRQIEETLADNE